MLVAVASLLAEKQAAYALCFWQRLEMALPDMLKTRRKKELGGRCLSISGKSVQDNAHLL